MKKFLLSFIILAGLGGCGIFYIPGLWSDLAPLPDDAINQQNAIPDTVYVSITNGSNSNDGLSPYRPLKTISNALAIAKMSNISKVHIASGWYFKGNGLDSGIYALQILNFTNFHVSGGWDENFSENTGLSYFELNFSDIGLFVNNCVDLSISRIFVLNGATVFIQGGALKIYNSSNVTVKNSHFVNNDTTGTIGGALHAEYNSDLILSNCAFKLNKANAGGALFIKNSTNFIVLNCDISSNSTVDTAGAIFFDNVSSFTLENNTFISNRCGNTPGGNLYISSGYGVIKNNLFHKNYSQGVGGVFNIFNPPVGKEILLIWNTFTENRAEGTDGGAIYTSSGGTGLISIYSNQFTLNSALNIGGSIYSTTYVDVLYNTFLQNAATGTGGIYSEQTVAVLYNHFEQNQGGNGSAYRLPTGSTTNFNTFNMNDDPQTATYP